MHDGCEDPCCLTLNIIQDSTTCISACSTAPRQERLDADLERIPETNVSIRDAVCFRCQRDHLKSLFGDTIVR